MRRTYSVIAWIIAGGVVVQAAAIAFGFGGMVNFIQEGGVVDKALLESRQAGAFTGELGFPVHALVGGLVIPLAAIALLIVSFFLKVRCAKMWAALTLGLVAVQMTLGYAIPGMPYAGLFHGANAIALLLVSMLAALRVRREQGVRAEEPVSDGIAA